MAYFLNKEEQRIFDKHLERRYNGKVPKGEREYSAAFLSGFSSVWDNDGRSDPSRLKSLHEKNAYSRGLKFAKDVRKR